MWRILGVGEAYRRYRRWMDRRLSNGGTFIFYFELSFVIQLRDNHPPKIRFLKFLNNPTTN